MHLNGDDMSYDGSLKFDTKIDESGFSSGINKLGSIAKGGLAVLGGLAAGAATAFGVATKAALDSVASLEQNIGGVETLFKESADAVIENAKGAYQTAGMSANEYMSTVTSFSASLLQSLAGDTQAAADVADMAITDMSDNANKMGTSMESIQNAYQGFAKQNYTMLDNLKLGYGGTKTEMERLLKDAQKLTGVKYDINNLSDVYEAIHVIQTELGITGTTAKEAATTIEGSMGSAKAAWDNFLNGTGDVDQLVDSVTTAGAVILNNLGQIVPRLLVTIPSAAKELGEEIVSEVVKFGPSMAEAGLELLRSLTDGISENVSEAAESGAVILEETVNGVLEELPTVISTAGEIVTSFAGGLLESLPSVISSGTELLNGLINGIIANLPSIVQSAMSVINGFVTTILNNLPSILSAGIQLLLSLVNGIINSLPTIVSAALSGIASFINTIVSNLPKILQTGIKLLGQLAAGLIKAIPDLIGKIPQIIKSITNAFTSVDWASVGLNIIKGIASGLANAGGLIIDAAKTAAKNAFDAAKEFLGIRSPSRLFRDVIGKNMALGMAVGFDGDIPAEAVEEGLDKVMRRAGKKVASINRSVPETTKGIISKVTNNYTGNGINYKKIKQAQKEALNEANERPIILNGRQVNRAMKDGEVVLV